uniref:Osiris 18 n=1 Tax=Stomoxys calcitrans TaxID=35570 RepID=A0A1I8PD93_STOCA
MNRFLIVIVVLAVGVGAQIAEHPQSATDLAFDMYRSCLKDFSTSCVQPKAMRWFNTALQQDEVMITDKLSLVRTGRIMRNPQQRAMDAQERMFQEIDNYLVTHSLRIRAPEYFQSAEARSFVPDFLLNNALTKGAMIPLAERDTEGRGMIRKAVLPFLLGLKLKTTVLVPIALALIALKTWKAMTLGLLSLVLSGALVVFKIAKPKIVNYEVVHYPHHHEHIEHIPHHYEHVEHIVPHHVEHIVPHHLEHHVDHHLDHHLEIPHHVEHVEHLEHAAPTWDPHAWARSSQETHGDAQDMAFAGQKKR